MRSSLILLAAVAVGCGTKDEDTAGWDADADTDTDSDTDTDADADTDVSYFEPAAIGFEYVGGWDVDDGLVNYYSTDGTELPPYVLVTLATVDYFGADSDETRIAESCEIVAAFQHEEDDSFDLKSYDDGSAPTEVYGQWSGTLQFTADQLILTNNSNCTNMDPSVYEGGDPVATFADMTFGFGLGPITEYLLAPYDDEETKAILEGDGLAMYVAINHPNSTGGVDFEGFDWSLSRVFQWDDSRTILVDDDSYLIPSVTKTQGGYVQTYAYWYEDFPNLDLSKMKD